MQPDLRDEKALMLWRLRWEIPMRLSRPLFSLAIVSAGPPAIAAVVSAKADFSGAGGMRAAVKGARFKVIVS